MSDELNLADRLDADAKLGCYTLIKTEHAIISAALRAAPQGHAGREVLQHYADTYCEGWCKDNPTIANFDDCGGCKARLALYPAAERTAGREVIARLLAQKLWSGATFDESTKSEREAWLEAADAVLALILASMRQKIPNALVRVISKRDDMGHTHFVEIRDAVFASFAISEPADVPEGQGAAVIGGEK